MKVHRSSVLAGLWLLAGCHHSRDPAPVAPPPPLPITVLDAGAQGADGPLAPVTVAVTEAMLTSDLARIAVPRHHRTAPQGLTDVASYLQQTFEALGYTVTRQPVEHQRATADNLIAERPGTDPAARVLVVTAHYDAVPGTPGADDNGSGTAGLLALARVFRATPTPTAIRFVAFCFEEQGMVGSNRYVRSLDEAARTRIAGVYNLDMIGYATDRPGSQRAYADWAEHRDTGDAQTVGNFISVAGTGKDGALLAALDRTHGCEPEVRFERYRIRRNYRQIPRDLLRSDHAPFWEAGVPAVLLEDTAELRTPYYHEPTDTVATLDLAFAAGVVRWVGDAVLDLSSGRSRGPASDAGAPPPRCIARQ